MKWAEIKIKTTQEAIEPIANVLHEAGAGGVIIEDDVVDLENEYVTMYKDVYELSPEDFPEETVYIIAYFAVNSYLFETIDEIKESINNLRSYDIKVGKGTISISEVSEEDWANNWKQYYKPVKVSERFLIVPTWEKEQTGIEEGQLMIELDPGMAFGTGTHPTTVLCLHALEKVVKGNEEVIDVGCGTGVLSIAAGKLGAKSVLALDLDEVAVNSCMRNTKINHVDDKIEIRQNNLLDGIENKADIIIANILAEVILRFTNDAAKLLKTDGVFVTSGIIQSKAQMVQDSLEEAGLIIQETLSKDDWVAFIAKKV